jgi:hypothetical protein
LHIAIGIFLREDGVEDYKGKECLRSKKPPSAFIFDFTVMNISCDVTILYVIA